MILPYLRCLEPNLIGQELNGEGNADIGDSGESPYVLEIIKRDLERMPHRQVLDFLTQCFVSDLNW